VAKHLFTVLADRLNETDRKLVSLYNQIKKQKVNNTGA
jgi:type IV pilus assembly protein PilB